MNAFRTGYMAVLTGALTLGGVACSDSPIVLRSQADRHVEASSNADDPAAARCEQLRDQIRVDRQSSREAPTTSTSPEIVAAAQGQADKRIDDLQDELESSGCNDSHSTSAGQDNSRLPPMQPAPNGPNR
ncbi:MAG TPA: hypothetical protein VHZ99_00045 [Steroidobacteraceae bacterium]|nr:hypothetical protein [Steroidobacteraceae bacterium]